MAELEPHLTVTATITNPFNGEREEVYCGTQPEWAWPNRPWKVMMRRELLAERTGSPRGWQVNFHAVPEEADDG